MPSTERPLSRRRTLAALGSAATVSLAGCVDAVHAPTAYCQLKAVSVDWSHDGQRYRDELVWALGHLGEVRCRVAEETPTLASGPREVTASQSLHDRLDRTFLAVDYLLGFCGDAFPNECRNTAVASREEFNAVQVGDEARVSLVDHTFHVHSVATATDTDDWEREFRQFDFSELHAEHGVPLAD